MKEFNSLDIPRQIKWSLRRLRDTDSAVNFHLRNRLIRYNINFVIDISQINVDTELVQEGEVLPAYDTSMMDVVLDIGPAVHRAPGNTSEYISPTTANTTAAMVLLAHPSPPEYERGETRETTPVELETITPPPAYLNQQQQHTN